jgi:UDP-N-acetylmuramyl pentapeptide synthase
MPGGHICFASDSEKAGDLLCELVAGGDVVLMKGSRGVKMERALERLRQKFPMEAS